MTTSLLTAAPTAIPDDIVLDVEVDGDTLGDDILLSAAASEKVQRAGGRARPISHHESAPTRAWTRSGSVD